MNSIEFEFQIISTEGIIKKKKIGEGAQGKVYLYYIPGYGEVAIKSFKEKETDEEFLNEVKIISKLNAPNIVRYYGILNNYRRKNWIVMEYIEKNSLYEYIQKKKTKDYKIDFPYSMRYKFCLEIISGLYLIHEKGIIHKDLKSSNILISSNSIAKISDFGHSKVDNSQSYSIGEGTLRWKAPETFTSKFLIESDIYSFGLILYEIASGMIPFNETNQFHVLKETITNGQRPLIPEDCPIEFANIIIQCWDNDPKKRPTSLTLLNQFANLVNNSINSNYDSLEDKKRTFSSDELFQLAQSYEFGKGISINLKTAIFYYKLSSKQNNQNSNHRLGLIYFNGELNETKNINLSIEYFEKGNEESFNILGDIYLNEENFQNYLKSLNYY